MTPIPTPAGTLFREFRIQAFPYIAFMLVVGLTVWLWRGYVGPATWVGEVESVRGVVSSVGPGRLAQLQVDALQRVTAGQVVARVITVEPRILEAQISLSKARIDLIRVGIRICGSRTAGLIWRASASTGCPGASIGFRPKREAPTDSSSSLVSKSCDPGSPMVEAPYPCL